MPSVAALQGTAQCDMEQGSYPFELHECQPEDDGDQPPAFKFRHSPYLLGSFDLPSSGSEAGDSRVCSFDFNNRSTGEVDLSTWTSYA